MSRFTNFSTYTKTLLLIVLSSVSFILLFVFLYYYNEKQEDEVYKTSIEQFDNEVNSLLVLNSESYISTITDVTYWDELVKFISSKNQKWFDESIGSTIEVYKVDYISVYDLEGNIITKVTTPKVKSGAIFPKELFPRLYKEKLLKFYIKVPEGVGEVFAATIHPSNDPHKEKSLPSGYFFMMRLLNKDYFNNLQKISSSQISFANNGLKNVVDKDSLQIIVPLKDWKGEKVSKLAFKRHFAVSFKATKKILYIIIFAFLINLLVNLLYTRKWLYTPLLLITRTLETGNKKSIAILRKIPGEFGYIGNLFYENNAQRKLLEKAKEKAEESDRLKSSFLTNLSHEIRTPMNAIIGFADLLKNENLSESERQEYINVINQSGVNLVSIIDDLIEMSKIDAQQITPNYSSVDLNACLRELFNSINVTISKEKDVELRLIESSTPLTKNILTDVVKLKQIITNLLTNAIKFTDKGFVSFGYELDPHENIIHFRIQDTGLGIDEENHKMIFDRFKRVEGDYSIKVGGLGLGLAISKAYVEMLGGNIALEESHLGVGSVFTFFIPLQIDQSVKEDHEEAVSESLTTIDGTETILVAEDDNINYLLLEKIMASKHYKIIRAKNGEEAVAICRDTAVDLVLMDIKMPVLSGYEAITQIREFKPKLHIIAQTAYSTPDEVEKIMKKGFTDYISKPLNKEKLFELLNKYLNP